MNTQKIEQIFLDTMYVHTSGTPEELAVARYLQNICAEYGMSARLEPFEVNMASIKKARLTIDGREIPCKGYLFSGTYDTEAPLYYLENDDKVSLSLCKGKIVMISGDLKYWMYQDLLANGAVGFITYNGDIQKPDLPVEIEQKELRLYFSNGNKIPGVSIHVHDAFAIIESRAKTARIEIEQDEYKGTSHNLILDLPGESKETIVMTAHYDTVPVSCGSYDNMAGCIVLLGVARYFQEHPHHRSLRFIWCGSEERGLLGTKAYCAAHETELSDIVLDVNIDLIGCTMGKFVANCSCEEEMAAYIRYMGRELGINILTNQNLCASDSTAFADHGVPSLTLSRRAAVGTGGYHTRRDTFKLISVKQMQGDIALVSYFMDRMANARIFPVERTIPEIVKEQLDKYMNRKR